MKIAGTVRQLADVMASLLLTLWVGGLWVIGYFVAPTLFDSIADRQLAGEVAGRLFTLIGWVGMVCATYLLFFVVRRGGAATFKQSRFLLVVVMLVLTLSNLVVFQPMIAQIKNDALPQAVLESALRDRFAFWHAVSGSFYLLQSVVGAALVAIFWRRPGV